jgi:HK97 family phage major capsid protein
LGILLRLSIEVLEDARNLENVIRSQLATAIALELDRVGLLGSGVGEPCGLLPTAGLSQYSMGTNGATPANYDPFSIAVQRLLEANAAADGLAVIMAPRTWGTLDRFKEATTLAPLQPPASYAQLARYVTNQIPTNLTQGSNAETSMAFVGDFKQMLFGMRSELRIEATRTGGDDDAFAKMDVLIRAYLRADVAILRPNHFTKIVGIKA